MAHHKSALKRIRQAEARRINNKFAARTTRKAINKLKTITDKTEATEALPKVTAMLDKLAKRNIIHANKAANLKSGLASHVSSL